MNSSRVKEPDDQDFLLQHYNNLQREPESKSKSSRHGSNSPLSSAVVGNKSVVGPVGSSSLSLPSVERAMQEKQLLDEGKPVKSSALRKEGQSGRDRERDREREREGGGRSTPVHRNMASVTSSALQSPSLSSSEKGGSSRPTSPLGSGQVGSQTPKQSEVLHSFFQSLLKEKGPGSAGGGAGRSSASRGNATGERKSGS
jgi:dynein light intermediate chain 1